MNPIVKQLGYAGLVPFFLLALAAWVAPDAARPDLQRSLSIYGAVILSFVGAVHWGVALVSQSQDLRQYVWGVLPGLLGWLGASLPLQVGVPMLSIGLIVCWLVDRQLLAGLAAAAPFARGYLQLRTHLTFAAWAALLIGRLAH
jgi:hypothetical protein